VKSCILYPFLYHLNFSTSYMWALEFARKINLPLTLVTIVSAKYSWREKKACSHALVNTRNNVVQSFNITQPGISLPAKRICLKAEGASPIEEFAPQLTRFAEHQADAILILPPNLFSTSERNQLIDCSYSTIVLPEDIDMAVDSSPEKFYEIFSSSDHFKMPDTVLYALSKDRALFNYFTSVFGRRD
jgi:hypothetical protein